MFVIALLYVIVLIRRKSRELYIVVAACVIHANSTSIIILFIPLLTGSYSNAQAVNSDYGGDQSARPLLPPGSRDDGEIKEIDPEEEVGHASNPATSGRVIVNSYSETC